MSLSVSGLLLEHFTILHGLIENKLQQQAISYLINTINSVKLKSPEVGIVLCGDFNHLLIKAIINSHPDLKQVVKNNTRGDYMTDLTIANLSTYLERRRKCNTE